MARIKIIGEDKYPHINKKSGLQDCNKLGRFNPKPMVSWNTKRQFDNKREYAQFIHNDDTIHNLGPIKYYRLNQMRGHLLKTFLKI